MKFKYIQFITVIMCLFVASCSSYTRKPSNIPQRDDVSITQDDYNLYLEEVKNKGHYPYFDSMGGIAYFKTAEKEVTQSLFCVDYKKNSCSKKLLIEITNNSKKSETIKNVEINSFEFSTDLKKLDKSIKDQVYKELQFKKEGESVHLFYLTGFALVTAANGSSIYLGHGYSAPDPTSVAAVGILPFTFAVDVVLAPFKSVDFIIRALTEQRKNRKIAESSPEAFTFEYITRPEFKGKFADETACGGVWLETFLDGAKSDRILVLNNEFFNDYGSYIKRYKELR